MTPSREILGREIMRLRTHDQRHRFALVCFSRLSDDELRPYTSRIAFHIDRRGCLTRLIDALELMVAQMEQPHD